jgi:hypothetical protein
VKDADGKVWLDRQGHAILLHPYERIAFWRFQLTAEHVLLDTGGDELEQYPHERLHKMEVEPVPYPTEHAGLGRGPNCPRGSYIVRAAGRRPPATGATPSRGFLPRFSPARVWCVDDLRGECENSTI